MTNAAFEISTVEYEFNHGAKPRGRGNWAFYFGFGGRWDAQPTFAPTDLTFSEAKAWARREARTRGATEAAVGS